MFLFLLYLASSSILSFRYSLYMFLKCLLVSRLIWFRLSPFISLGSSNHLNLVRFFDLTILSILHRTLIYSSSVHNNLDSLWQKLLACLLARSPACQETEHCSNVTSCLKIHCMKTNCIRDINPPLLEILELLVTVIFPFTRGLHLIPFQSFTISHVGSLCVLVCCSCYFVLIPHVMYM
jgi:hypothetical protein